MAYPGNQRYGLVDLGSNSITGLMVKKRARALETLHTMTEICGIGRGMSKSRKLNRVGIKNAFRMAERLRIAFKEFDIGKIEVIATAAVRESEDGEIFAKAFGKILGLPRGQKVKILPGRREAEISANGVMSSFSDATGLCIDLGGGSTELTWIEKGSIKKCVSIPVGTLTLKNPADFRKALGKIPWLKQIPKGIPFYLVGGSFRAIGRIRMQWIKYPLDIVHGFKMTGEELSRHLREMKDMKRAEYTELGISKNRAPSMPAARAILQELVQQFEPKSSIISKTGLREGYVFAHLPPRERHKSPLLYACTHYFDARTSTGAALRLESWLTPLLKTIDGLRPEVVRSLCFLSDCATRDSSRRRADSACTGIMDYEFGDCTHRERAMMALTAYARYAGKIGGEETDIARRLLDKEERKTALMIGLALKLAYKLGEGTSLLDKVHLHVTPQKVTLHIPKDFPFLEHKEAKMLVKRIGRLLGRKGDVTPAKAAQVVAFRRKLRAQRRGQRLDQLAA